MLRDMPDFMLEIVEGPEAGRRIPLSGPLEVGRDPMIGAPLLQDELVSARHVRVTPLDDGARVEDLGSRNGTFVDGDQIFSPAFLAPESQLLVGVSVLQLRPTSEASAGRTVVVLPLISLSWIENGGEFRKVGWSVAPEYQPLPMLAAIDDRPAEGKLVREFTSTHTVPDLQIARPLTALHQTPPPSAT